MVVKVLAVSNGFGELGRCYAPVSCQFEKTTESEAT